MNEERIKFSELANFFPKQKEALEATKKFKFVLYGGSVGSGKSRWLRWTELFWLMWLYGKYDIKGIRAGLFCEDYPSLNDRHLSKIKYEFPEWLGTYNEARHEFVLEPEYGSGVLAFRNLDDVSKYLSVEFAVMGVDEINRNQKPTFDMLRSRLRWPGIKDVKFMGACNPLGEAWVKNMWVKRLFPIEEKEQYEFCFISALPTDNPHLPPEYFKGLENLPEAQRKAYLEGNWDAFGDTMDEQGYIRLLTDTEYQSCVVDYGGHTEPLVLGVDPAAGGDNSAVVVSSANLQEVLFNQKLNNIMDFVGVVADIYRQVKASYIVVDKTGIGQGVFDRLHDMDFPVKGVNFGDKSDDEGMYNKKAELYWLERKWLLGGGRLKRNDGWNEFEVIKWKNKNGHVIIQPKEELFRSGLKSPNVVDAAVLTRAVGRNEVRNNRIAKQRGGVFFDRNTVIWRDEGGEVGGFFP